MTANAGEAAPRFARIRAGWGWLVVFAVAEAVLAFTATLAVIAILPTLLLGWQGFVVQSGSMEPVISAGDVALVSPLGEDDEIPVGMVIAFQNPAEAEPGGVSRVRLHRVAAIVDGEYITAGDANAEPDSAPVSRDQIIGPGRVLVRLVGLPVWWITHGDVLPLVGWVLVMIASGAVVGIGFPRKHRASRPSGIDGSGVRPHGVLVHAAARHGTLAVIGVSALITVSGLAHTPAQSAYTAQTRTSASWSVAAGTPISVGRMTPYGLFAGGSIADGTGVTSVLGSVGTSPGTTITGFSVGDVTGSTDRDNTAAQNAKIDADALSAVLAARPSISHAVDLSGTITPGTYRSSGSSFTINGTVTLDGGGDPSAVFVFTAPSLSTASSSTVLLTNGASAKNIFWRIAGSATLGANSIIRGTVIAVGNITAQNKATVIGRLVSLGARISTSHTTVALP